MGKKLIIIGAIIILILAVLVPILINSPHQEPTQPDKKIKEEMDKLLTNNVRLAIYPYTRSIDIKQGDKQGFAFSVRNTINNTQKFIWEASLAEVYNIKEKCPGLTSEEAESWIVTKKGEFSLNAKEIIENPEFVLFTIPDKAPLCILIYNLKINEDNGALYATANVYVTIEGK